MTGTHPPTRQRGERLHSLLQRRLPQAQQPLPAAARLAQQLLDAPHHKLCTVAASARGGRVRGYCGTCGISYQLRQCGVACGWAESLPSLDFTCRSPHPLGPAATPQGGACG